MRRSGRLVVVAALVLASTGCSQGGGDTAAKPGGESTSPSGSPTGNPSASPSASGSPTTRGLTRRQAEAEVARLVISHRDFPSASWRTRLVPKGDEVSAAGVTLNYCGVRFRSESRRLARRQVLLLTPEGQGLGVSNEVVAYDSPGAAKAALQELRRAVRSCTPGVLHADRTGGGSGRYDVRETSRGAGLPVADRFYVRFVRTARSGETTDNILVFQRQGQVLDGLYLAGGGSRADRTGALKVAAVLGSKLTSGGTNA